MKVFLIINLIVSYLIGFFLLIESAVGSFGGLSLIGAGVFGIYGILCVIGFGVIERADLLVSQAEKISQKSAPTQS